jgi:fused signal recognition particle receptor
MINIDGIIITKLDGTAKGGSIFSIAYALKLPILYVGVGEQPQDLIEFDKYQFVDGFLDAIFVDDEDKERSTFSTIQTSETSDEEVQESESDEPTLEEISRLHTLDGKDKSSLIERLKSDGYDMLSRHFVRDQNTWNDFKLVVNEQKCQWEIHAKDGSVLKEYPLER